ncbi:peptide-methionine (S)-S-oxide reductase MsrA [Arcanobacterium ihumii]|uniref:peptide-methionine (S)-S-oxide reductase MsrA n=1 Tax=Arcanobacterium ihumii TaxID=2138162 RepID=UPI000F53EEDC|nr:peptide-methionine (S)-S-oxide reductase MsrA [Arcanobacterium ihumii]
MFIFRPEPTMVSPNNALPGRSTLILPNPGKHLVLGSDILKNPDAGEAEIFLAAGCYWGVEEIYWNTPGVVTTAVGFMGGFTPNPTYQEVCTGETGHTETVRVVHNESEISTAEILKTFFECHDPTTLNRQGNDVGTQYRSAIFTTTPEQYATAKEMLATYEQVLKGASGGKAQIVTEVIDAAQSQFYPAEDGHQQYLYKNPDGYRCHTKSGMACPLPGTGPLSQS